MSPPEDASPGSGEPDLRPVTVTVIDYDAAHFSEWRCTRPEEIRLPPSRMTVTWIIVDGVHDPAIVEAIGNALGIHPLTQEDIMNTRQRPKIEEYEDYLYVAVRAVTLDGDEGFRSRQVSLLLGNGYIVSFQEQPDETFNRILKRLRAGGGRVRSVGSDYLFYALLDAVVDGYFSVIEDFGERIETIEEEVLAEPDRETLQAIYAVKRSPRGLAADQRRPPHLLPRRLRPRHRSRRGRGDVSGYDVRNPGYLPLKPEQPDERDNKGLNHNRHDLHSAHVYRRDLRHEL